jgi:cyclohexa-1,5-dienecarbonyl-CoA hydratase
MDQKEYQVSVVGGIATITMDRPPVNVLNISLMEQLTAALQELEKDPEIKLVVITGAGTKAFSAGVEVADHTPDKTPTMLSVFSNLIKTLIKYDKPTLAAVNGFSLGGGLELMMACDMVIATEKSKFGQPEIQLGVTAPIASVLLPRMIGWKKSMEILLTGDALTAQEAREIGLVNKVVPEAELAAELEAFAKRFEGKSSSSLKWARRTAVEAFDLPWEKGLDRADELYLSELMKTEDAVEGINAFMEKRKPIFKNK